MAVGEERQARTGIRILPRETPGLKVGGWNRMLPLSQLQESRDLRFQKRQVWERGRGLFQGRLLKWSAEDRAFRGGGTLGAAPPSLALFPLQVPAAWRSGEAASWGRGRGRPAHSL